MGRMRDLFQRPNNPEATVIKTYRSETMNREMRTGSAGAGVLSKSVKIINQFAQHRSEVPLTSRDPR